MNRRNSDISAGSIFTVILAGIALFCVSSFLSHLLYGLFSGLFVFSDPFFRTASGYLCFIPYWI
ncbi:MAG: hypothetical protein Q4F31_08860, partial [Eubacteriales bacterium]|nr:hypothetical protein [Eubacteriales bacterium]